MQTDTNEKNDTDFKGKLIREKCQQLGGDNEKQVRVGGAEADLHEWKNNGEAEILNLVDFC